MRLVVKDASPGVKFNGEYYEKSATNNPRESV